MGAASFKRPGSSSDEERSSRDTQGFGSRPSREMQMGVAMARAENERASARSGRSPFGKSRPDSGPSMGRAMAAGATLTLAIAFGLVAFQLIREPAAPPTPTPIAAATIAPIEQIAVLVPVAPIERGRMFDPVMFSQQLRPKFTIGDATVRSFDQLKGLYARAMIPSGQPFSIENATPDKLTNEVIDNIPKGFRALTINVNATTGVEGWARAGAFVDVHWISDISGEKSATLIVENARVLSAERRVDPETDPSSPIPTTVTLLVAERDARRIGLATTGGSLVLHLRGSSDTGKASASSNTLTVQDLMPGSSKGGSDPKVQGYVKIHGDDGRTDEWAVVNGKIVRKAE